MKHVKICRSCGKVMKKQSDFAQGDMNSEYCNDCTDEFGYPQRYSQVIQQTKDKLVKEMGITETEAEKIALENVANIPHWADNDKLLDNKRYIIITDIGSTTTKAVLLNREDGDYKILSISNAGTTVEKPNEDVNIGVRQTIRDLEQKCNVILMNEEEQFVEDVLYISTSSAGGGLQIMVIGLTMFDSASSAKRTAYGAGGVILDTFAIDDKRSSLEQMKAMGNLHPDIILMSGGVDGGAISSILRLGEILQYSDPEAKFSENSKIPLVYAGNKLAQDLVAGIFQNKFDMYVTPNLRPTMQEENLAPAREKIHQLFMDSVMEQAPGYSKLKKKTDDEIIPTPMGVIRSLQIISESRSENVMSVDIGGATTDIFSHILGEYYRTVSANYGMSYSISNVMKDCGYDSLREYISADLSENEIRNYISNKMLYPTFNPTSTQQIAIEHALAINAIRMSKQQHLDMNFNTRQLGFLDKMKQKERGLEKLREAFYVSSAKESQKFSLDEINIMIGAGGVLAHTQSQEQALSIIYHGLSPLGITEIWRDRDFISPHLGKLSAVNESLATKLLENECFQRLALTIRPMGSKWKAKARVMQLEIDGVIQDYKVGDFTYLRNESGEERECLIRMEKGFILNPEHNDVKIKSTLPILIDCRVETAFSVVNQELGLYDFNVKTETVEASFSSFIHNDQIKDGKHSHSVKLPYEGDILVKVGDHLKPEDMIGENKFDPPRIYVISLFEKTYLNLNPDNLEEALKIKVGDEVKMGQRIIEVGRKNFIEELKFQHFYFESSVRGVVEKINLDSGTIIMREIQDYSAKPKIIKAAKILNVKPKILPRYLSKTVGDFVYAGDVIGKRIMDVQDSKMPMIANAPTTGTITKIDKMTGEVTIQYIKDSVQKYAGIFAKVASIEAGKSAELSYQGSTLHGVIGFGREHYGVIRFIADLKEIDNCEMGEIAVIPQKIDSDILQKLAEKNLGGVIAAAIDNSVLVDFIGEEIGVALTGNETIPFPLIITEGFGDFQMNAKFTDFFLNNNGKIAYLNGHTQIRAGVTRPVIILSESDDYHTD